VERLRIIDKSDVFYESYPLRRWSLETIRLSRAAGCTVHGLNFHRDVSQIFFDPVADQAAHRLVLQSRAQDIVRHFLEVIYAADHRFQIPLRDRVGMKSPFVDVQ
jgi:hypothetical protein